MMLPVAYFVGAVMAVWAMKVLKLSWWKTLIGAAVDALAMVLYRGGL